MRRRYWWAIGAIAAVAVVAAVAVALWPSRRVLPPARARVYTQTSACLLTDSLGVQGAAAPVWAGMESASLKTRATMSYLPVYGADTVDNATVFMNTLVQRRCRVIVAVGASEVGAVRRQAAAAGAVRFVVVGDDGSGGGNLTAITAVDSKTVSADVENVVEGLTRG